MPLGVPEAHIARSVPRRLTAAIYTEGGGTAGFGHVARCTALYDALEECGAACRLYVASEEPVRRLVGRRACERVDWVRDSVPCPGADRLDVAVIDSYRAPRSRYVQIAERSRLCLCIDDDDRLDYPGGIVLQVSAPASRPRETGEGGRTYWRGLPYHLLRKEFWDVRPARTVRSEARRILVTFGGGAGAQLLEPALRVVRKVLPDARIHVIAGRRRVEPPGTLPASLPRVVLHGVLTAPRMRDLMLRTDLAVSAGGQTLLELARCGVPTVAVTIAANQRGNVGSFVAAGAVVDAGSEESLEDGALERALVSCLPAEVRRSLSASGPRLIDGGGPRRVARSIIEALG